MWNMCLICLSMKLPGTLRGLWISSEFYWLFGTNFIFTFRLHAFPSAKFIRNSWIIHHRKVAMYFKLTSKPRVQVTVRVFTYKVQNNLFDLQRHHNVNILLMFDISSQINIRFPISNKIERCFFSCLVFFCRRHHLPMEKCDNYTALIQMECDCDVFMFRLCMHSK